MRKEIIIAGAVLLLFSCGPIARNTVEKKIGDNAKIGVEAYKSGNYESAVIFLNQALKDAYSVDNMDEAINVLQNLAETYLKLDDFSKASNYIYMAGDIANKEDIDTYDFTIYLTLGNYYSLSTNTDDGFKTADIYYQKALKIAKKDEDRALVYNGIGISYSKNGNLNEALDWMEKSRKINESQKLFGPLADNYFNMAEIYEKKNNPKEALDNYKQALKYDKNLEKSANIQEDLKRIGRNYQALNKTGWASYYLNKALNTAQSLGDKDEVSNIQEMLSNL
jgi:tetratricopeptide (TPR) repeat protein